MLHDHDILADALETVWAELLAKIPTDAFRCQRRKHGSAVELDLLPARPAAARIQARIENGWIHMAVGRGTLLEIGPEGRQYTERAQVEEFGVICAAVISGGLWERLWIRNDTIIKAHSKITLVETEVRLRYGLLWNINPLARVEKLEIKYSSYAP